MTPTAYFDDFVAYYEKAYALQELNISSPTGRDPGAMDVFGYEELHVADPLMHFITIYDCVERRYAGFSNALQQVWFGSENPKRWQVDPRFDESRAALTDIDWLWVFLVHRVTGSGASFSHDHGFRNSIIADMMLHGPQAGEMKQYLMREMSSGRAVFTSIGNQIPPFPKPAPPFRRGSELYLSEFAPRLCYDMVMWLRAQPTRPGVQQVADQACAFHRDYGVKQFKFVLTAWAMDMAEYMPHRVDPHSHVHYGKNALESLDLLFTYGRGRRNYEAAMDYTIDELERRGFSRDILRPYSLEDVLCDYVRYIERFVPKGYEHLKPQHVENASAVDHPNRHRSYYAVKERHGSQ